ncbi:hypothetical protein C2E23DRAFT_881089 [Lenzites betulinus]|nr:hypothetical protein C2E23DRAFT_881089 [Lenzites betulinus]
MGQYWQLREEKSPNAGVDKLGIIYFVKQPYLVRSLAVPYTHPKLAEYLKDPPPPGPVAKKGLLSLPDELLTMLLESPDISFSDTICFAVTCKKLLWLSNAKSSLLSIIRDYGSAHWAHCRIACIGEYADPDDTPDSIISPPMKEEIRKILKSDSVGQLADHFGGLTALGFERAARCLNGSDRFSWEFLYSLPEADYRLIRAALLVIFPPRDDWVLINMSKHEYVRAGPLADLCGNPKDEQPFLTSSPIDLGTALMTRFCFSTSNDISIAQADKLNLHCGPWAGDRFCITTFERMIAPSPEYPWKDVTDEVIADIVTIFKAEFGDKWEEELKAFHGPFDYSCFRCDDTEALELPHPEIRAWRVRREKQRADVEAAASGIL